MSAEVICAAVAFCNGNYCLESEANSVAVVEEAMDTTPSEGCSNVTGSVRVGNDQSAIRTVQSTP